VIFGSAYEGHSDGILSIGRAMLGTFVHVQTWNFLLSMIATVWAGLVNHWQLVEFQRLRLRVNLAMQDHSIASGEEQQKGTQDHAEDSSRCPADSLHYDG